MIRLSSWHHAARPLGIFVLLFVGLGVLRAQAAQGPATFTDADDDQYTVRLTGPGTFAATLSGGANGSISLLSLAGTSPASKLTITVTQAGGGDGRLALGAVIGDAGLNSIAASACDLGVGGVVVSGGLSTLTLGDVGGVVIVPKDKRIKSLALTARTVGAVSITVSGNLRGFTVKSSEASISAAAIGAVKVLDGNLGGVISTPGAIASLTVTGGDLLARIGAKSIGPIKLVKSTGGLGGSITNAVIAAATKISALTVAGSVTDSKILAGVKLGTDVALGGVDDASDVYAAGSVGRVSIAGSMTNTILGAGLSPFDGIFANGNDGINGGKRSSLGAFTVTGSVSADSRIGAGRFATVKVGGARILVPALDPRFVSRKLIPSRLPADPAMVAPPVKLTTASNLADRTAFLYTGKNPIQTGVAPGTIVPKMAATVRGRVRNQAGGVLTGEMVTVLDHTEYGETFTRLDGMYDFALNGGATYNLLFEMEGFAPVQRQVVAPMQDALVVPDVVMMTVDPAMTTVAFGDAAPLQVHTATMHSDADGNRQATLMFPAGTKASLEMPDGTLAPMNSLNIRATEYTVGGLGPAAMPGSLPGTSAYTYCVGLTADEATAANATSVVFSQPVWMYIDNFTNFTVGIDVPCGSFNREKGVWEPDLSGKIIKVLSATGGLADVDTDGDTVADNTGIGTEERQMLAARAGQTLWRIPILHFTDYDPNWPFGPPNTAKPPNGKPPKPFVPIVFPDCCDGSTIEAQTRVLGEDLSLVGVPYDLHYRTSRVPGRKAAYQIDIPLSDTTIPAGLTRIELDVSIAGRMFHSEYNPTAGQSTVFEWDGKDAFGRRLTGKQTAEIDIGFVYAGVYQQAQRFGFNGTGIPITGSRTRQEVTLHSKYSVQIGAFDLKEQSLGGWSFDIHHAYDPVGQTIYEGNGNVRQATSVLNTITTIAGIGQSGFAGDGDAGKVERPEPSRFWPGREPLLLRPAQ